ncbi:transcriptional regulator, MarR family [Candidatus Moduliflexus flocculans]|uniref:Transcriptional regulator, MarR family n=1 Tax=Candidatus Moduliflexus flocculans TaxID=1499966 RepID=A0A081BQ62_9BACT|nr:transcriptional regulator, MarR family [Candidatus Moduliflexus flocculans]
MRQTRTASPKSPSGVISQIAKIRERINQLIVQELREHEIEGIVTSHGDIFYALFRHEELTMQETADLIGKDKSTVTALVDKLMKAGFIEKRQDETDRRVSFIRLTEAGERLRPDFHEISITLLARIYAGFTEQEKETLISLLTRIQKNIS